jgi:hypothetical protein
MEHQGKDRRERVKVKNEEGSGKKRELTRNKEKADIPNQSQVPLTNYTHTGLIQS